MSHHNHLPNPDDALAGFVSELLGVGGVLSQIIAQMVRFDAELGANPDAVPIPLAAHELLLETLKGLKRRYSRRDLKVAAAMLKEATDTICEEVFFIPPDELQAMLDNGDGTGDGQPFTD